MKLFFISLLSVLLSISNVYAREQIRIAGSSTVFPFASKVAEEFAENSEFPSPLVESTGTGSGIKLFCEGNGKNTPDISNASRKIKKDELALCAKNGINNVIEIKIGYDGIVIANDKSGPSLNLTDEILFKALAKNVVKDGKIVENYYKKWSDIDPKLPDIDILVYGPPPTSGTRDAFVELVMEKACKKYPQFKEKYKNRKAIKNACHKIRLDGAYVEAGENDNIVIKKIVANKNALGIFGYNFLQENNKQIKPLSYNGFMPEFKNILDGKYDISRSMYLYVKPAHIALIPGLKEFLIEFVSDNAMGEYGYLIDKGLIPLALNAVEENRKKVSGL